MNESFDDFRSENWQENGILLEISSTRRHWGRLRRAETWATSVGLRAVAGLMSLTVAVGASNLLLSPQNAAAVRRTTVSTSQPQFATESPLFEVSPKLWDRLIAYVDTWPDLPEEQVGPESEPFV
jgi:hypothetical protein